MTGDYPGAAVAQAVAHAALEPAADDGPDPVRPFVGPAWRSRKPCRWRFDLDRIQDAAVMLGITHPVLVGVVEAGGHYWTTHGTHRVKGPIRTPDGKGPILTPDGFEHPFHHRVTVRRTCGQHMASRVLWHELTHALQAERSNDPLGFYKRGGPYAQAGLPRTRRYTENQFEVEANASEDLFDELELTKGATS